MKILNILENYKLAFNQFSDGNNNEMVKSTLDEFKKKQSLIDDPEMRDINYWRRLGFDALKTFVASLDKKDTKRKKKARIQQSGGEILTVKKTDDLHLFIPLSEDASCFYGSRTNWCISTKSNRNYFNYYTVNQGYVVFMLIKDNEIYALVLNPEYASVIEVRDGQNNLFPMGKFFEMAETSQSELVSFAYEHEKEIEEAKNKQRQIIKDKKLIDALKSPVAAYDYAMTALGGERFPAGESLILANHDVALRYAKNIIGGRWPELESLIVKNPRNAYLYAKYIVKGRWPEGEAAINSAEDYKKAYNKLLGENE